MGLRRRGATLCVLAAVASLVAATPAPASLVAATPAPGHAQARPSTPLLRVPFPQDDGTLTPYSFELGYPLVNLVYDTLFWRDEAGVPQPWLARSLETSADGRQLTLKLAEGAKWQDGMPVTAADVAFTFRFVAAHPHPRFTAELEAVDRVRDLDATTVVIDLRHPSPGFLDQPLADLPILPKHIWQGLSAAQVAPAGLPVGSGPYRLSAYRPGESYRFEANAEYFRGPPAVDAIEVPIMASAEATLQALERGQVDMIPVSLSKDLAARLDGLGVKVTRGASYVGTVLLFNLRRPPFDRVEVRQAVGRALDLARIARNVSEAVPADRGYLHPQSRYAATEVLQRFDEAAARDVLAPLQLTIEILVQDNDPARGEAARQLALALGRVGVGVDVKKLSRQDVGKAVGEDGSAPDFQAAIWSAPPLASQDPDFLRRLFGSSPGAGPFNYGRYRSPRFDAIATRIGSTSDPAARLAAVTEALQLLATDLPVIPLFFSEGAYAYRQFVFDGWVFVKGSGILDKRSFVEPRPAAGPPRPAPASHGPGKAPPSPLSLLAFGLVALTGLLVIVGLVRSLPARAGT